MNKTAIKNFAIWARTRLIEDIKYKASLLGITEKGVANPLPQSTSAEQYYDIGTKEPNVIIGKQITQRRSLAEAINNKAKEVDYKVAYNSIMEAVAYTWFNRLIAVRFMEVNDYLPCKIRVLSAEDGRQEPDIVRMPMDARLDYSDAEVNLIRNYQLNNASDELFQMLFIKVCNDLSSVLPQLFEKQDDYTELLLNISYTNQDGLVYKLVHDIPQEDFDVEQGGQVEIIGWLYQYYNTELKRETFALLDKNIKITKERIPSVTQIFTPDWIVRYMVENSLGRLWIEGHQNYFLKNNWKYYLDEVEQETDVKAQIDEISKEYAKLNPEDIKVIDPCMGSGHILVYAFDVLMQIYLSVGYSEKDAAISILENNLYGLDIDDRAFQLAYFAVLMKARQYHKFILKKQVRHNIHAIVESNGIKISHLQYFGASLDELSKNAAMPQMQGLIDQLKDAREYGSILTIDTFDWDLLRQFVADFDITQEPDLFSTFGIEDTQQKLQLLIDVGELLAKRYDIVVTNPPYMKISSGEKKLIDYINRHFIGGKTDMFAVFIERASIFASNNGFVSMITQPSLMSLVSFERLRRKLFTEKTFYNLIHMGRGIFGIDFGSVSFVYRNCHMKNYVASYFKLHERTFQLLQVDDIRDIFLNAKRNNSYKFNFEIYDTSTGVPEQSCEDGTQIAYLAKQDMFMLVPGVLFAYTMSDDMIRTYRKGLLGDVFITREGMATAGNDIFLRLWHEVSINNICFNCLNSELALESRVKWFPYNKGGDYRKWYGNNDYIVDWENDGHRIRNNIDDKTGRIRSHNYNGEYAFRSGLTWSAISAGDISIRWSDEGFLFDSKGAKGFAHSKNEMYAILGFLNSSIAMRYLKVIAPTMDFKVGDIVQLPLDSQIFKNTELIDLVKENILLLKETWDYQETSWDFKKCFAIKVNTLKGAIETFMNRVRTNREKLRRNEERINTIIAMIYNLHDTRCDILDEKLSITESTYETVIKAIISYAVGCMFGRYSLDVEGLAYAGGEWDASKYATFLPDEDNVIPITDEDYFEDDIVGRFVEWLKAVYGDDSLEENLLFIANALGTSGDTPRQCIRNYFLKDFYKDHCKVYQKRPIYWLYDSGKQNGFKALIYMHRYNEDTTGKMRVDYLARMEETYESEINREQNVVDSGVPREAAKAAKRIEKLKKQLKECRDYDVNIGHIALSRIAIDLDDGVKVNYEKVQTGKDGTVLPILAKI